VSSVNETWCVECGGSGMDMSGGTPMLGA
jgi:hypothetical protein